MNPRKVIRKDGEVLRDVLIRLENLEGYADAKDDGFHDLEKIGSGYLTLSLRLERIADQFKARGAAYLGI